MKCPELGSKSGCTGIIATWNRETEGKLLDHGNTKLLSSVLRHTALTMVNRTAEKYCVSEIYDFSSYELQIASTKLSPIRWAKPTHIATYEHLDFEDCFDEQTTHGECQAPAHTVGLPATCYSYDLHSILTWTTPIDGVLSKVLPVTFVPVSYTCLTTPQLQDISGRDVWRKEYDYSLTIHRMWTICTKLYANVAHAPRVDLKWRTSKGFRPSHLKDPLGLWSFWFRNATADHDWQSN